MNFLALKQRLARRRNKNASTIDTLTNARLGDFFNEVHRELLSKPGMAKLRDDVTTFATVASQQRYALPEQGIAKLNRVWDATGQWRLRKRDLAWLREVDPNPPTGNAEYWIPLSYTQVHTQPADASEIFAKSTAVGDTTQTIYVEGIITGGYRRTASATLNGTTAVTLNSAITNFIQIDKCYLSAVAVGIITLHEDSGSGTELSRIAIGDLYAKFLSFLLYPTPAAVRTLSVDFTRGIADMSNDTDEPLIPEDFHDLLIDLADLKELTKGKDSRYDNVQQHATQRMADFKYWMFGQDDDTQGAENVGSNLGSMFPEGRW